MLRPESIAHIHKCIIYLIIAFICSITASADFRPVALDMRDGLPESRIRSLCSLPDGRTAILTAGYLSIFDGVRFSNFLLDVSYSIPLADYKSGVSLFSDGKDLLWIKKSKRLFAFDLTANRFISDMQTLPKARFPAANIANFFIDNRHRYWFTMPDGKLYMNSSDNYKSMATLPGANRLPERLVANDSIVVLCYERGHIDVIDITTGKLIFDGSAFSPALADSLNKDISVELVGDNLIIGHDYLDKATTKGGITSFNLKSLRWNNPLTVPFHLSDIVFSTNDRCLYAAGSGFATVKISENGDLALLPHTSEDMLQNGNISCLLVDTLGSIWGGTIENGILYSNDERFAGFTNIPQEFPFGKQPVYNSPLAETIADKVTPGITNSAIADNNSRIFIASRHGLIITDNNGSIITRIDSNSGIGSDNIQSVLIDNDGAVWFAGSTYITMISPSPDSSFDIINYGKLDGIDLDGKEFRLREMAMDSLGTIYIGYPGGMYSFSPAKLKRKSLCPKYNTKFFQNTADKSENHSSSSALWLWSLFAFLLIITVIIYLYFSKRKKQKCGTISKREQTLESLLNKNNDTIISADEQFLARLSNIVDENLKSEDLSVQKLSELMAMDRTVLYRKMQSLTGVSPSAFIKTRRMNMAARLLSEGGYPIATVAEMVGFSNARYFSKVFKDTFGVAPNNYKG